MVRSNRLTRDRFQIFNDLDEHERAQQERGPNNSFGTRWAQNEGRGLLVERGIDIDGLDETTIPATIDQRGWSLFTTTRETFHEGLVREFYASMVPEVFHNCGLVWVQGVQVEITSEVINDYLQTPSDPNELYDEGFRINDNFHP